MPAEPSGSGTISSPVFVAVLVPVVTAAVGMMSLLVQDWRARRSRAGRRRLAFEEATVVAQGWLGEASARVTAAEQERSDEEPPVSRGRLLLLYRFRRRPAKVIRIGFYTSLGAMAFWSLAIVSDVLSGQEGIGWDVAYLVLFGALALFLRFWAVSANSANSASRRSDH